MARKRKKSKARKKARKLQEPSGADATSPDEVETAAGAAPEAAAPEAAAPEEAEPPDDETEERPGAASKSEGASKTKSKEESGSTSKSKGSSKSRAKSKSKSKSKTKSKSEAESEDQAKDDAEVDGEAEADEAKAKPKAKPKAKSKPKAKAQPEEESQEGSATESSEKEGPKEAAPAEESPEKEVEATTPPPPKSKRRRKKKGKTPTPAQGQEQEQAGEGESEAATAEATPAQEEDEPEPIGLDDVPAKSVAEVIAIDDDLDEPGARDALIAAVAGLAVDAPGESTSPPSTSSSEAEDGEDILEGDTGDVPEEGELAEGEDGERPVITSDALLALSEFRQEGVASIPGELVLDLGEATTEEERDRLLAAAMAHAEMQDAVYRVRTDDGVTRRWKGMVAALVFLLALFTATLPPSLLTPEAPASITDADREHGLRVALLVQARQVEAFRVREGRLPNALAEVATTLPDIRYVKSSNRLYQLVGYLPDGEAIVYDSAAPDPTFERLMQSWLAAGASS